MQEQARLRSARFRAERENDWKRLEFIVNRAEKQGVHLGLHTLSNFITTNDPYVTPIPDPRLAKVGSSVLVNSITYICGKNLGSTQPDRHGVRPYTVPSSLSG